MKVFFCAHNFGVSLVLGSIEMQQITVWIFATCYFRSGRYREIKGTQKI